MTSPESLVGQALAGVYVLEEVIATGSTSMVFRGTNRRLDQQVAVKVLFGSFTSNTSLMARFEAEARVQAKLNHPHIIRVFDFVADGGSFAIVMELVEGVALDQILYDLGGPMELRRIKALMCPVLDAVGYAHAHGIVHRDIKPSNIIVSQVGRAEFPKVMDFGIAKVQAEGPSNTAPGAMLGTLLFMSPEQCKALKSVDERADIYSIGVTLYQMTTGMVPFYAESAFEIMLAHVQTPPTPPKEFVPKLPDEMQELILRCLAKDPDERYADVGELAEALEAIPTGTGGAARAEAPAPPEVAAEPSAEAPRNSSDEATPPKQQEHVQELPPREAEQEPKREADRRAPQANQRSGRSSQRLLVREEVMLPSLDAAIGSRAVRPRTREGLLQVPTGPQQPLPKADKEQQPKGPAGERPTSSAPTSHLERAPRRGGEREVPFEIRERVRALRHDVTGPERPEAEVDPRAASPRKRERIIERPFMSRRRRRRPTPTPASSSPKVGEGSADLLGLSGYSAQPTRLRLRVANRDDWARYYDPNTAGGGIFCPTSDPPEVGAPVRVEITFVSGPRFFVRGAVTWRRPKLNDPRARAGVGVQVHATERNKVSYVNSWVNGHADDKRALRRLPVKLRVTYTGRAGRRINFTRDLNEEGIFVRSRELLALDTPIQLLLMPPNSRKPFALEGVVSRLVEDSDDRGMGIRLRFTDSTTETAYASLVEELEQEFLSGTLPDAVLA